MRIVFAIVATHDSEINVLDFDTVSLNAELKEDSDIKTPKDYLRFGI